MAEFVLRFLGSYQVQTDQKPVTDFHSDKVRALLAYFALEQRQYSRGELAALRWPEIRVQAARANLRSTLHRLRQTFDAIAPGSSSRLLTVTRQSIQFNPERASVNVHFFRAAVQDARRVLRARTKTATDCIVAVARSQSSHGYCGHWRHGKDDTGRTVHS